MAHSDYIPSNLIQFDFDFDSKTNVLKVKPQTRSFVTRIKSGLSDVWSLLNFKSKLIEEYYYDISYLYSRRHYRSAAKYYLIYTYIITLLHPVIYPGTYDDMASLLLYFTLSILGHLLTLCQLEFETLQSGAVTFLIFRLALDIYVNVDLSKPRELVYSALSAETLIVVAFIRLDTGHTLIITLYIVTSALFTHQRLIYFPKSVESIPSDEYSQLRVFTIFKIRGYDKNSINFILAQIFLYTISFMCGLYIHIANQIRRRASFLRLIRNIRSQSQVKEALKEQMKCIESIMPAGIKNSYWGERKANMNLDMWVFSKCYSDVSILFADIVGFTNMSSNKTAAQVVTLLNDLFHRFDQMCELTRCEKIATLGDCYYCISGCPIVRKDHAVCCIEMGLGMCRIIQAFNLDYNESVNMRVGVHTGRVNAAIIGNIRFRFDVYSNDVLVANEMESSGQPGRVHISETTYKLSKYLFKFEKGEDLEVKKEVVQGIQGLQQKTVNIKTYFVKPESSYLIKASKKIEKGSQQKRKLNIVRAKSTRRTMFANRKIDPKKKKEFSGLKDIGIIKAMRRDPDKQIRLFNQLPVWPVGLQFADKEVETHYHEHTRFENNPISIDSGKLSNILDSIACMLVLAMITAAMQCLFPQVLINKLNYIIVIYTIGFVITIINGWNTVHIEQLFSTKCGRLLFLFTSHPCTVNFLSFILCSLPMWTILLAYDCNKFLIEHMYTARFFSLSIFSGYSYAIFLSSLAWVNNIGVILNYTIFTSLILADICVKDVGIDKDQCPNLKCHSESKQYKEQYWPSNALRLLTEYFQVCLAVIVTNRQNEKNLRLEFYSNREANIQSDDANRAMLDSKELLHNIIPQYALRKIVERGGNISKGDFSYAENVKSAAVIFSCISNFFSKYYREDYKEGKGALTLLNKIICMFDDNLKLSKYRDVEKIKTINDCYMVASGLNTELVAKNRDSKKHLKALMHFSFDMLKTLEEFNTEFIFGSDKFEMKIGYNIGPVTAGVIGTTKPMFDIWGDTVNVASRMYSTGAPGIIQVPKKVKEILDGYFMFTFRDIVTVKGKGEMETYIAQKRPR